MFQLIVAVISIALIAALALASIPYLGDAFNQGSLKGNVTTLINGGQQISGAQALYKTEHAGVTAKILEDSVADAGDGLVGAGDYLTAVPGISGAATGEWGLNATGRLASVAVLASNVIEICAEADRQAGNDPISTPTATSWAGAAPVSQFGCFTDGAAVKFGFKL